MITNLSQDLLFYLSRNPEQEEAHIYPQMNKDVCPELLLRPSSI